MSVGSRDREGLPRGGRPSGAFAREWVHVGHQEGLTEPLQLHVDAQAGT